MINKESSDTAKDLQAQLLQVQTRFGQLLEAAETDNYEVWEMRQQWERFQGLSADFAATVTGWQGSFIELQMLDIGSLIPDLETFGKELGQRFADIERMLAGQRPEHQPAAIDLALDETGVQSLSHFHRAALAVTHTRLLHLEVLSRSLFETVFSIQNFDQEATVPASKPRSHAGFVFDPDRLASVFRVMLTLWVTYIALIYIPDLPGGPGLVNMAGVFAMILAGTPQLPINMMYKPVAYGILFGAFIHIFVMPHFSSFYELGFLLFTVTFGISYLYAAPQQALSKIFGIAMFLAIAGIDNQQVYSLFGITTTATMFAIIFLMLSIIANIPFSASSEKVFLRLLSRYFHSCAYLVHNVSRGEQKGETRLDRLQKKYHAYQVASLPKKLGVWARFIDTGALPGTEPPQIQAVLTGLQSISYRMKELLAASSVSQESFLLQELQSDMLAWRKGVEETLQKMAGEYNAGDREILHEKLTALVNHLERRITAVLDRNSEKQLSEHKYESFYRLLGSYRGVSEALVDCAGSAHSINWSRWQEERF
jgi:hypothetical protein